MIAFDPAMGPFRDYLAPRGVRAAASFPLFVGERVLAVLTLVSDMPGVFDYDELKVLNELAGDLSFGLLFLDREEQLSYLACYDVMTALPNRRLFQDRLTQLLHPDHTGYTAIVLINLDRFAQLNDAMGRHAGDALLVQIARRLAHSLPDSYSVARIGGDTFAVSLSGLARIEEAADILQEQVFAAPRPAVPDRRAGGAHLHPAPAWPCIRATAAMPRPCSSTPRRRSRMRARRASAICTTRPA
ncbi:sensor domain-containing diguanylate cyclase [Massilia sp. B-10]|nr:sensor domain-containing diguanylate cyclase [Massilia sp. B-10]